MPWSTPTLRDVRGLVRDNIRGALPGADANIPNSVLRVLSDTQGGLCHLVLQYVDWLSLQLLPDTAETEWLDRHGDIWLVNADGTTGRKVATLATGTVAFTGVAGMVVPQGTQLQASTGLTYETTAQIMIEADAPAVTNAPVRALDPGTAGNVAPGTILSVSSLVANVVTTVTVIDMGGGTDEETDDELRARVLQRIRQPPMGGAKHDYERWVLAVPGVTRAWCGPLEMGMGTVTVRFMMDDLRSTNGGFPTAADVTAVTAYLNTVRPVAVKDYFVVSPIPQRVDVYIMNLVPDSATMRANIEASLQQMLADRAEPGQTIFAAWKYYAIMGTPGVESFDLRITTDDVMPSPGHLAVLGDIVYGP
jgi:uncharacterized phage protein gp47/JayE